VLKAWQVNEKMKRNWSIYAVAASFLFLGFLVLLDQYLRIGVWIQWQDLLHHEPFALALFALGVGIFIGSIFPSNITRR
jgi:hypothetical protein